MRREFDETEAYLRHRARVHEKEMREKLKKEGKLAEYMKKKEAEKAEEAKKHPKQVEEAVQIDELLKKYQETKKLDIENSVLINYSKFDVDEKKVEKIVKQLKTKKQKVLKAKKARMEQARYEVEMDIEEPEEFKPKMAGQTGLPSFFFSNVVKQNRSAFQKADARNRMTYKFKH